MKALDTNILVYAYREDSPRHAAAKELLISMAASGRPFAVSGATGAKLHDARIAAICLSHGVSELLSADRDFSLFPASSVRNPLSR